MSMHLGKLSYESFSRIWHLLEPYLQQQRQYDKRRLCEAMGLDKKSQMGSPIFVLLGGIGELNQAVCSPVEERVLNDALDWMNDALRSH